MLQEDFCFRQDNHYTMYDTTMYNEDYEYDDDGYDEEDRENDDPQDESDEGKSLCRNSAIKFN